MAEFLSDATLLERFVSDREEAAFCAGACGTGLESSGSAVASCGTSTTSRTCSRRRSWSSLAKRRQFLGVIRRVHGLTPWRETPGHAREVGRCGSRAARRPSRTRWAQALGEQVAGCPSVFTRRLTPRPRSSGATCGGSSTTSCCGCPRSTGTPVVLCDLEEHTHEEAAQTLGWPAGSMSRRLDRARSLLRRRLTCRGVALGAIGLVSLAIAAFGLKTDRVRRIPIPRSGRS